MLTTRGTARAAVRSITLALGMGLVAVGCGPTATPSPSAAAVVTDAPAETFVFPSFALPSFAVPSFVGDAELEALIPDEIAGKPVSKTSVTGESFLESFGTLGDAMTALLGQIEKTPQDLSVCYAGTDAVTIVAYRIKGVPATTFFQAFILIAQPGAQIQQTDETFGGKAVTKVVPGDGSGETVYAYTSDDIVFIVGGDLVTDALLDETFSKLP